MAEGEHKAQNSFQSGNLIQFLKVFSKEEMKELSKFVSSPFHNNRSEVTNFFEVMKKFHPDFDQPAFTKENIFAALYPEKKYQDDVIRRLSSNLFKLAEEYAAYKNFKKDRFDYEKNLLEFYFFKNADKFFWKQHTKAENYLE